MVRKSAASAKLAKKITDQEAMTPEEVLDIWKQGELLKIESMKKQLARPDSYLKIRKQLEPIYDGCCVKGVGAIVNTLIGRFDEIKGIVEGLTVEKVVSDMDYDPFKDMFKMVDPEKMTWKEIINEEIYFETIRPFAEHYFQLAEQLYIATSKDNGDDN